MLIWRVCCPLKGLYTGNGALAALQLYLTTFLCFLCCYRFNLIRSIIFLLITISVGKTSTIASEDDSNWIFSISVHLCTNWTWNTSVEARKQRRHFVEIVWEFYSKNFLSRKMSHQIHWIGFSNSIVYYISTFILCIHILCQPQYFSFTSDENSRHFNAWRRIDH